MKSNSFCFFDQPSSQNKIRYQIFPLFSDWFFSKNQNTLTSRPGPKITDEKTPPSHTFNPFHQFGGLGSDPNPGAISGVQAR